MKRNQCPLYNYSQVERMKEERPNKEFLVLVSYLEIYNEIIKDLLNPTDKQLKIREHPKMGVYVVRLKAIDHTKISS